MQRSGRSDVLYPGHDDIPAVPLSTQDLEWMPVVAQRNLIVITRDRRIRTRPAELRVYWEYGIRPVCRRQARPCTPGPTRTLPPAEDRLRRAIIKYGAWPWALAMSPSGLRPLRLRGLTDPGAASE